ncbi:hypothetical protein [Pararobbsia silviterrae]|nr:hypothetical protein [Pararobbsia silviterrae]
MKTGLISVAAAALVLSGCYYPGPYVYYPTVPAQSAGVETIPPNSPDYPQQGSAQTAQPPASASQAQAVPPGYNGGAAYYAYPAYPAYPTYPAYYGYPAYPGYPVYGGPAIGLGFSFGGHWR